MKTVIATVVSGLLAQQAAAVSPFMHSKPDLTRAQFNFLSAPAFSCPANTNNQCSSQKQSGWDFSGLASGLFSQYDTDDFSGFTCNGGSLKRYALRARDNGFSGSCVSGTANAGKGPSFSCGSGPSFSPTQYYVKVDRPVNVVFNYDMGDGTTCQHTDACETGGSVIANTQCGGAKSVTLQLPETEKEDCGVHLYQVNFDCSPAQPSSPPVSPPASSSVILPPVSSPPAPPTSSKSAHPSYSAQSPPSSSAPPAPSSTSVASPVASQPSSPPPPSTCPDLVPQCMNTWLFSTGCKDNTECGCYCTNVEFITNMYSCFMSWSQNDDDVKAAVAYFVGICADHIPSTPAIIAQCPPGIPIAPPPSTQPGAVYTTVTVNTVVTVPCAAANGTAHTSSTTKTVTTTCTVPQVTFVTPTAGAAATQVPYLAPAPAAAFHGNGTAGAKPTGPAVGSSNASTPVAPLQYANSGASVGFGSWMLVTVLVGAGAIFFL
jgi:hypothetical protein